MSDFLRISENPYLPPYSLFPGALLIHCLRDNSIRNVKTYTTAHQKIWEGIAMGL